MFGVYICENENIKDGGAGRRTNCQNSICSSPSPWKLLCATNLGPFFSAGIALFIFHRSRRRRHWKSFTSNNGGDGRRHYRFSFHTSFRRGSTISNHFQTKVEIGSHLQKFSSSTKKTRHPRTPRRSSKQPVWTKKKKYIFSVPVTAGRKFAINSRCVRRCDLAPSFFFGRRRR